jgi:hypothetical protein
VLAVACQVAPYTSEYVRAKPAEAVLVGTWTPTEATAKAIAESPYRKLKPRIVVRANGAISFVEMPSLWRSDASSELGRAEDFEGSWALEHYQESWWGVRLRSEQRDCSGRLGILNQSPPYILVVRYDDPDAGHGLRVRTCHQHDRTGASPARGRWHRRGDGLT